MSVSKVVLVTGSSGGLGIEICKKFNKKNYIVLGADIVRTDNQYINYFYEMNISNENHVETLVDDIKTKYNRLDCLINNAGMAIYKSILETTIDDVNDVINSNLVGLFLLSKHLYPLLNNVNGNIVNIGSVHSISTSNNIAIYSATKSAIVGVTKNMAIEFGPNIRVNCVSPGAVNTSMLQNGLARNSSDVSENLIKLKNSSCINRISEPDDIADIVYFVSSKYAKSITGANIIADNGVSVKLASE